MNLNKQDFAAAVIAFGVTESLKEKEVAGVATMIAGEFATSTPDLKRKFLRDARAASNYAIFLLQQLNEKLDTELASIEDAKP